MQEGPPVEKCPIAIQFLGTYVIVMGVSNRPWNIEMETFSVICLSLNTQFYGDEASLWTWSSWIYKKSHLRVWMLKFW